MQGKQNNIYIESAGNYFTV